MKIEDGNSSINLVCTQITNINKLRLIITLIILKC